jgi:hypothetical protein
VYTQARRQAYGNTAIERGAVIGCMIELRGRPLARRQAEVEDDDPAALPSNASSGADALPSNDVSSGAAALPSNDVSSGVALPSNGDASLALLPPSYYDATRTPPSPGAFSSKPPDPTPGEYVSSLIIIVIIVCVLFTNMNNATM